jgi:hypothetical protein
MSNQYRLVEVGNAELVAGLSRLVQRSNELTAQVLAHLVELDERRLHLELGFSSLFAYCVEALGMSEGIAGRRVTAVRVCRRFPGVFDRIARGELHLCALCALAPHLNEQNAAELFEESKGKTRRQIEALLAARFPKPDVREQIRRFPAHEPVPACSAAAGGVKRSAEPPLPRSRAGDPLGDPQRGAEFAAIAGGEEPCLTRDSEAPSVEPATDLRSRPRWRELEPLSADRFGVHFTADAELRELIERARALASHQLPNGDLASLMKLMVASFVKQEEKRRFGLGTRPRRASLEATSSGCEANTSGALEAAAPPGGASVLPINREALTDATRATSPPLERRSRYVAVQVRREIYARDEGQCAFVSRDGRRCGARAFIQVDHVDPFARNGASDTTNLRLLCQSHNLLYARKCFGDEHISTKIARNRSDLQPWPR